MRRAPGLLLSGIVPFLVQLGCGGSSSSGPRTTTSERGVRIHLVSGSSATAQVYAGSAPSTADEAAQIVHSPAGSGYVLLGDLGPASALDSVLSGSGDYQYVLIKLTDAAVSTNSTAYVRIDAIQRLSDGMYWTGRTYTGDAAYGSNGYNDDRIFQQPDPGADTFWNGAPDGRYVALFGYVLMPLRGWAP
jgi:hypothetical protein